MSDRKIEESVKIPEGIECRVEDRSIIVKGPKGTIIRPILNPKVSMDIKEGKLIFIAENATKREKTFIGTLKAHSKNMFKGAAESHSYTLKICSGHFPMNVSVSGRQFIVKNFLGEKVPRTFQITEGVKVTVSGTEVVVEGHDKEHAGQVAASIEQLCRITNRDRRIFQDGIYITNKDGKGV